MGKYENLSEYKDASAKQKLAILATEMTVPVAVIHGYATILKRAIDSETIQIPEGLQEGINKLVEAANDLKELREVLFGYTNSDL